VAPGEVFAAQFLFLAALTLPAAAAVVTSLPRYPGTFTAGVVLAGATALLAALLGSLGIDRRGATVVAATLLSVLDVVVCSLLFFAAPGSGFFVLAVLPVAWVAIQLPPVSRALVLGTALTTLLGAQAVKDVVGDQPWRDGIATVLNLSLLFCLSSWAGARWTRRNLSQRRLLESQTRLVGSALDAARTQERTLAEVLDVVDFAVVTLDADGTVTANRAAEELARRVGAPDVASVVRDGPLYAADGFTALPREDNPIALARAGEEVEHASVRLGRPGPAQVPLSVSVRRVRGHRSDRLVVVARDVSPELADAQARDDAVAAVSHEIKTPLTAALGHLELALEEPDLGDGARELVEVALASTERMLALSQDFLATRTRSPGVPLQVVPEPCHPAEVVHQAVEAVRPLATERLVTVTVDARTDVSIEADPLRLRQVVDNLLTNAVKYNRYDGTIEVVVDTAAGVRTDGADGGDEHGAPTVDGVCLQVHDTGHGMSPEELEGLFTRFYRTTGARESGVQGTGLGLGISRDIVLAHGGTIDVRSEPGEGTTVTVWLPRRAATGALEQEVAS
jgi:signal transduction histidine kinase